MCTAEDGRGCLPIQCQCIPVLMYVSCNYSIEVQLSSRASSYTCQTSSGWLIGSSQILRCCPHCYPCHCWWKWAYFCWTIPSTHTQTFPQSMFCYRWWVCGCQVCCCCCCPHCQHLKTLESKSINFHLSQNQCCPCNCCWGGGVEMPLPAMLASSLPYTVSLLVSFLLVLLSSSVLSLTTLLMTESLMPLCGLAHLSLTFSLINFSPLPTLQLTDFPVLFFFLSYSVSV